MKVKFAAFEPTELPWVGPEAIVVAGAVVSTTHEYWAGVASSLSEPSTARTRNTCGEGASPTPV